MRNRSNPIRIPAKKFITALALIVLGIFLNQYFSKPEVNLPRRSLSEFPKTIGDWQLVGEHKIDPGSMKVLNVDDYIMWDYQNSAGDRIGLYIGYFTSQKEGKGIHSPRQCLPGAGWMPLKASVVDLPLRDHNPAIGTINKYIMGKGLDRQLVLFWYHGRGRIYAGEYWNKIYLILDGIIKKRTDGALIRVNMGSSPDSDETFKKQLSFIGNLMPLIRQFIPE